MVCVWGKIHPDCQEASRTRRSGERDAEWVICINYWRTPEHQPLTSKKERKPYINTLQLTTMDGLFSPAKVSRLLLFSSERKTEKKLKTPPVTKKIHTYICVHACLSQRYYYLNNIHYYCHHHHRAAITISTINNDSNDNSSFSFLCMCWFWLSKDSKKRITHTQPSEKIIILVCIFSLAVVVVLFFISLYQLVIQTNWKGNKEKGICLLTVYLSSAMNTMMMT